MTLYNTIKLIYAGYAKLPSDNKKLFWKLLLFPHIKPSDNVSMYIGMITSLIILAFGLGTVTWFGLPLAINFFGMTSTIGKLFVYYAVFRGWSAALACTILFPMKRAIEERRDYAKLELQKKQQQLLDQMMYEGAKQLTDQLSVASGRQVIPDDPISIASAHLDIFDKNVKISNENTEASKPNDPIKAALKRLEEL